MSSFPSGDTGAPGPRDPLTRFLLGCALVAAVSGALALFAAFVVGWRWTRDDAAGRPSEAFLVGDETRYWRFDVRSTDDGLRSLLARLEQTGESTRRGILKGTLLEALPLPRRRARLEDVAPLTIEVAFAGDPDGAPPRARAWSARATLSRGILKLRAALKLMRWAAGRDPEKLSTQEVDGVDVTEIHDGNLRFAVAAIGNRILAGSDVSRLRSILGRRGDGQPEGGPDWAALHEGIALSGEDGWAFVARGHAGDPAEPITIDGAVASFDVNERDELGFRVAVLDAREGQPRRAFRGTTEDCAALASALLPGIPVSAIVIDGNGAEASVHGARSFTGRVAGLSTVLASALTRATGPKTPSATPTKPSLPPTSDRRIDTP